MIDLSSWRGVPVAVFGLGRSGLSAAAALKRCGARVVAWDDNEQARRRAAAAGVELVDLGRADWSRISALVLSPGVPLDHPEPHSVVRLARAAGAGIIGDMELLAGSGPVAAIVGITGTNGKSTTTALIGHIVAGASARPVQMGGNLGVPALDLETLGADGCYVLEMSSYQLELTRSLAFDIAVLLNISADHLDRHGGMEGYIAAKKRIFNGLDESRTAVVGVDDAPSRSVYEELKKKAKGNLVAISGRAAVDGGVYVEDGVLYDGMAEGRAEAVVAMDRLAGLRGVHNAQNAAAAYAVARVLGIGRQAIVSAMGGFPGLAHRQELLAVIDGVSYVNDSKATNGEAAARALACYGDVFWIAGGRAKEDAIEATRPYWDRLRHAYLIGEAANDFARVLAGRVPATVCGRLSKAVGEARRTALDETGAGAVVLLSPACASFDQFDDFECRGEAFRDLVDALPGRRAETAP